MRFNSGQISCLLHTKSPFMVLSKIDLIAGKFLWRKELSDSSLWDLSHRILNISDRLGTENNRSMDDWLDGWMDMWIMQNASFI
jgi:hypothetical protein